MVRLTARVVFWLLVVWTAFASYHLGRWSWHRACAGQGSSPIDGQGLLGDQPLQAGWVGPWWIAGAVVLGCLWWGLRVAARSR